MTQTHERYNHAKIYKLVGEDPTDFYIGSTCLPLRQRLYLHKSAGKKKPNIPVYSHFNALNWQGVQCVLIEEYECLNKEQLLKRERHFVDLLNPTLNKLKPWISKDEYMQGRRDYYQRHAPELREKQREYYAQNAEQLREKARLYYKKKAETSTE